MRKEINLAVVGSMLFSAACAKPPEPEITSTLNPTPTHEPTPTFEPTPTLPANLEGAKQWKEGCLFLPVIDPSYIGTRFSADHQGVDFGEKFINYPAKASISGTVVHSSYASDGGGISVITETPIEDGLFVRIRYAHLGKALAAEDQEIRQGQRLGIIGSTGNTTEPHLHFEIVKTNWPFDKVIFNGYWFFVQETVERIEEFEKLYGEEQTEWIDPLGLIKETCQ